MSCENIDDIVSFQKVIDTIQQTEINIKKIRKYLIDQLNYCGINDTDNCTFKELIDKVADIDAPDFYNSNNTKPTNEPSISDATDIFEYFGRLYQRIRYYMRLLAYYLVLKGIPTNKIANETTLMGLISLIRTIKMRVPSIMTVAPITNEYYFGENIFLNYNITDNNNNPITEGEITIECNGTLYDSIIAGEPIKFTPITISDIIDGEPQPLEFIITYHGSDKYKKHTPIIREVIVLPSKLVLDIFISNINVQSNYYGDSNVGYIDDTWGITVKTYNYKGQVLPNMPFTLTAGNQTILETTNDDGTCIINMTIPQIGRQKINIKTTYENPQFITNTEKEHYVTLYYNPLYQTHERYEDYKGRNNYTYELIIRNKDTGAQYDTSFDGQDIALFLDNDILPSVTIHNGKAIANLTMLDIGEHTLKWSFQGNQKKTIIQIFSNFILPNKNKFFLTDTPDIYYAPLYSQKYNTPEWSPIVRKKVSANIYYYDENDVMQIIEEEKELYTDNNGILHAIKEYTDLHTYVIELQSKSDDLNESLSTPYQYEIAKPFDIVFNEETYDKKLQAEYDIYVYDTEHYNLGDYSTCISFDIDIEQYCTIIDEQPIVIEETEEEATAEYYHIHVIIPSQDETYGTHTLTMELNGYSDSSTFLLMKKVFSLLTDETTVGTNQIRIQCYNDDITDIAIESNDIIVNNITKENNIFIVDADFLNAGNIDFSIQGAEDDESFTIMVNKGVIDADIIIEKIAYDETHTVINPSTGDEMQSTPIYEVSECHKEELKNIKISFILNDLFYGGIEVIYTFSQNGVNYTPPEYYTFTAEESSHGKYIVPSNLAPGIYDVTIKFNGNNNYLPFNLTKQFEVLRDIPKYNITNKYTSFKNINFFLNNLTFTTTAPTNVTSFTANSYNTQIDGVWTNIGYHLTNGWDNTGLWECNFDIATDNLKYIKIHLLMALTPSRKPLISATNGDIAANPIGTYTRDNNNTLQVSQNTSLWCHISIQKISPTTLIITKTKDTINNGKVIYEWQELSNYSKLTFGAEINNTENNNKYLKIKNFSIRGVN